MNTVITQNVFSQQVNDLDFWLSGSDATTPSPKNAELPDEEQEVKVKVTVAPVLTSEEEDNSAKVICI